MILGMEGMILRIKREERMIKGKREDDDRGGKGMRSKGEVERCGVKEKGREIIGGGGV